MTTVIISISPGDIQVISNSHKTDGYAVAQDNANIPAPELSIVERNITEEIRPPLSNLDIEELHDKYKM